MVPLVFFVSCADLDRAKKIAKLSVGHRLAAEAKIVSGVENYFWQEGELETQQEMLLILVTSEEHRTRLEKLIQDNLGFELPRVYKFSSFETSGEIKSWIETELHWN